MRKMDIFWLLLFLIFAQNVSCVGQDATAILCREGKVPPCIKNSTSSDNLLPLLLLGLNPGGNGTGLGVSGSGSGGGSSNPITFGSSASILNNGVSYSMNPTVSGITVASCTVSPALPAGLSLNPATCSISGTPTAGSPSTTYTLNATDANGGSATGTVTFRVASTSAVQVFGQAGNFTTNTVNTAVNGGLSANSLLYPYSGIVFDSSGGMYVADSDDDRVLYYPANSTTATRVYGQWGSFITRNGNYPSVSANTLVYPYGLALDSSNGLYVADKGNNRVLYYPSGSTTATRVYGQGGDFTAYTGNNGGISATSLLGPKGLALDASGGLYVSDGGNNRVLYYPSGSTTATRVYGQNGSFTTNNYYLGGTSANTLQNPWDIDVDSSGGLYVADATTNRVLYFPPGSTTATRVYGQRGSFTASATNNAGLSANSLNYPESPKWDPSSGGLYIADSNNDRALYFPAGSTTATKVYGQGGSFTISVTNNGGISADSLDNPGGLGVSPSGGFFIIDGLNNRVLGY